MTDETRMPAGFFGHGSPMNPLEHNRYTEAWRSFGECVPTPRAVLVILAHWYTNATAVTAMPRPRVIHDFYGSISMTSYTLAADCPNPAGDGAAAQLPQEAVVPPEQANI